MLVRAVRAAAVAALVSWGALLLVCLLGWVSTSATTTPIGSAVGVASDIWAMANLGSVSDGTTTISLVPLGLVLWPLACLARAARGLRADVEGDRSARIDALGGMRRGTASALGAFVGCYVLAGVVVAILGRLAPVSPVWWRLVLGALVVAVLGLVVGLRREIVRPVFAPLWRDQIVALVPLPARRGAAVGLRGAGLLLLAGLVPVLLAVALRLGTVREVHEGLAPGLLGGVLLVLAQLLLLPNLAAWGLSWLAGPGFAIGAGSSFTWTSSQSVILPNVPLLGALPASGAHSALWCLALLVPVAVGAWIGSRALRTLSRLSSTSAKAQVVAVAVVTATVCALLALVLSGGALGTRSLADVGPRAVLAALALLAELGVGAALALAASLWRFNRR